MVVTVRSTDEHFALSQPLAVGIGHWPRPVLRPNDNVVIGKAGYGRFVNQRGRTDTPGKKRDNQHGGGFHDITGRKSDYQ